MKLWRLSASYILRSGLATALNLLLLALGVATITLLIVLGDELEHRLTRDAQGIDLVVGAKGSPLQVILSGVYHVDVPTGNIPLAEVESLRSDGRVESVIPISLGDSFRDYRIVGTESALVTHYEGKIASGRLWIQPFEAVLGADVARMSHLTIGQAFASVHGLSGGGAEHGARPYRVVGILKPTGTVIDRLVLTDLATVWEVHQHAQPASSGSQSDANNTADGSVSKSTHASRSAATLATALRERSDDDSSTDDREVTLALIRYATPLAAMSLPREINSRTRLQAASPAFESARLLVLFGFGVDVLRGFAAVLMSAAALGIFVALYRAMDERQYDIAIMRMLGATRWRVCAALLLESALLAAAGTFLGLLLGHALESQIARVAPAASALASTAWKLRPQEAWVVAVALGSAILAALLPAWQAYRLDVAAVLSKG